MVNVHTVSRETNQLKFIIENKIKHSYLDKYIQKPFIDLDKLYILQFLYKDMEIPLNKKQQYMTTIMLVQIALDIHEQIPSNESEQMSETKKQLSVLAGDYFSGLYYLLLSELEDIEMIQVLATAIQKINERKMILYYENVHTIEELVNTIKEIESLLFTETATYIDEKPLYTHHSIIEEFLLINRLNKEKELMMHNKFSYMEKFLKKTTSDPSSNVLLIENEVEYRKQLLEELLLHLPYHFVSFKNVVRNRIKFSYKTSVAEEG